MPSSRRATEGRGTPTVCPCWHGRVCSFRDRRTAPLRPLPALSQTRQMCCCQAGLQVGRVLFGIERPGDTSDPFRPGHWSIRCPPASTASPMRARCTLRRWPLPPAPISSPLSQGRAEQVALNVPDGVGRQGTQPHRRGVRLTRDLINTPSNDMGPDELEAAPARSPTACARSKYLRRETGEDFPLNHAVGMGSPRSPG